MKQFLLFIAAIMSLNGAATTRSKPVDPIVFSVNLPKAKVWQKVLDLFVANSIPIKFIDKSSGLIQSDKVGLGSHYALKNANDTTVWALCETINAPENSDFYLYPQTINTELQIYVRETTDSTVLLSINLMNLKANYHDDNSGSDRELALTSTKRLENTIANYLSTNERMPTLTFDPPLATFGESPSQTQKRDSIALENAKKYQELLKLDIERWRKEREAREKKEENEKRLTPLYMLGGIALGVLYLFAKINEKQ